MALFDPPPPFVLKEVERERSVVAVCSFKGEDGRTVLYVRAGAQWRSEAGEWVWKKGAGVTIPLRKLGALAAWLLDSARAIPRPDNDNGKGWAK